MFLPTLFFLPVAYRFVLVYTVLHRSFFICFLYEKVCKERILLNDTFKRNKFSHNFIDSFECINTYMEKLFAPKRDIHIFDKKRR